jgi:hypothetical protein
MYCVIFIRIGAGKLRQSLGEFYTPDWLVDFTLNKVSDQSFMTKESLIQPVVQELSLAVIRKKRQLAKEKNFSAKGNIETHLQHRMGF